MSGPATAPDDDATAVPEPPTPPCVEIADSRTSQVGSITVRRALPQRPRRTVGAWCFVDHAGPTDAASGMSVGPHPHIGLHTVTWLLEGSLVHRDSVGSEQVIRPGQLNLMTAGNGVSHAEEPAPGHSGRTHGMQLWVAQPEATRHGPPAFEHHAELPVIGHEAGTVTVLVGSSGDVVSPARADTELTGLALDVRPGRLVLPVDRGHEHAIVLSTGSLAIDGSTVRPGQLAYLGVGRDELVLEVSEPTAGLVLGGVPFPEPVKMWWNYVARTQDEITAAHEQWTERADRFGVTGSALDSIDVGPPPWVRR